MLVASGKADPARIYIAGLSQGGMGVLDLLARYPETFADSIAMCGAGDPATAKYFAGKPALWLFHGDKDPVVPPYFSQQYYRRLKKPARLSGIPNMPVWSIIAGTKRLPSPIC